MKEQTRKAMARADRLEATARKAEDAAARLAGNGVMYGGAGGAPAAARKAQQAAQAARADADAAHKAARIADNKENRVRRRIEAQKDNSFNERNLGGLFRRPLL